MLNVSPSVLRAIERLAVQLLALQMADDQGKPSTNSLNGAIGSNETSEEKLKARSYERYFLCY